MVRAKHIPEWEEYDGEVARFTRQLAEKGVIQSGLSVADSNVLADVGAGHPTNHEGEEAGPVSVDNDAEQTRRPAKDEL